MKVNKETISCALDWQNFKSKGNKKIQRKRIFYLAYSTIK